MQLKQLKQQLEYLLESHAHSDECRRITSSPPDVKPFDHIYYDKALERVKTESIDAPYDHNVFLLPSPKKVGFNHVFFRVFNRKFVCCSNFWENSGLNFERVVLIVGFLTSWFKDFIIEIHTWHSNYQTK